MSLDERAADFVRTFPHKKVSSTTLATIYKKHTIRKKKVRVTKIPNRKERKKISLTLWLYCTNIFRKLLPKVSV